MPTLSICNTEDNDSDEPDTLQDDDEDDDVAGSPAQNHFQMFLHAAGYTKPPVALALYKEPPRKQFQRIHRFLPNVATVTDGYLWQHAPVHLGPGTSLLNERKAYCYFLLPDWELSSRILADQLAYALLVRLPALRTSSLRQPKVWVHACSWRSHGARTSISRPKRMICQRSRKPKGPAPGRIFTSLQGGPIGSLLWAFFTRITRQCGSRVHFPLLPAIRACPPDCCSLGALWHRLKWLPT